jgi:ParB/RepB/Spo0J family partition protein
MVYNEISIEFLDDNPFQTRRGFDAETLTGIATSAMDELGIRHAPLVRPHPKKKGRYQIASGHGRVLAWKTLGKKTILCRIEDLSDSQMKKEILVENVNRANLSEEERMIALEAYREDLGLKVGELGFISKISRATGLPESVLSAAYDVKEMRNLLTLNIDSNFAKQPSQQVIVRTTGLPDEERVKLIVKAMDSGWGGLTVLNVKMALQKMEPEIRELILDEKTKLTHKTILAITEMESPELQKQAIEYIRTHKLNEDLALNLIERAKEGPLVLEIETTNEVGEILDGFRRIYSTISSWGYNEYMILRIGGEWEEALRIFDQIEAKIKELKEAHYDAKEVEGTLTDTGDNI